MVANTGDILRVDNTSPCTFNTESTSVYDKTVTKYCLDFGIYRHLHVNS